MEPQRQTSEPDDTRIHQELQVVLPRHLAFEEPEWIAAAQARLAETENTSPVTDEASPPAQALIGPERQAAADPHSVRIEEGSFVGSFWSKIERQMFPDLDPRQRQQARVGQARLEVQCVAAEGATARRAAAIADMGKGHRGPGPGTQPAEQQRPG